MELKTGQSFTLPIPESSLEAKQIEMMWIPPGKFLMGDADYHPVKKWENGRQFQVTISEGFWLGKYPVTQAQWVALMGEVPEVTLSNDYPINNVDWFQATHYCNLLNDKYQITFPQFFHFNLPSEAQWEYVCQSDERLVNKETLSEIIWHQDNSGGQIRPVGEKQPIKYGVCDLVGNVWEWCLDIASDYPEENTTDWVAIGDPTKMHCMRGESYGAPLTDFDYYARTCVNPELKRPWIGFRLCLSNLGKR